MNAQSLSPDAARLRAVRDNLVAIAPAWWQRVHDVDGCYVESRGEMGELFVLARFDPSATIEEITFVVDAPDTVVFLLRLLDQAFGKIRTLRGLPEPGERGQGGEHDPKNFAAECAMKCKEPAFKAYLEQRHGLDRPLTDERVAQRVRTLLGVQSRKELNDGGKASDAWKDLRADFAMWQRGGQ